MRRDFLGGQGPEVFPNNSVSNGQWGCAADAHKAPEYKKKSMRVRGLRLSHASPSNSVGDVVNRHAANARPLRKLRNADALRQLPFDLGLRCGELAHRCPAPAHAKIKSPSQFEARLGLKVFRCG